MASIYYVLLQREDNGRVGPIYCETDVLLMCRAGKRAYDPAFMTERAIYAQIHRAAFLLASSRSKAFIGTIMRSMTRLISRTEIRARIAGVAMSRIILGRPVITSGLIGMVLTQQHALHLQFSHADTAICDRKGSQFVPRIRLQRA